MADFLSYRTRIARHFDSHACARSTTQRRGWTTNPCAAFVVIGAIGLLWALAWWRAAPADELEDDFEGEFEDDFEDVD